MTVWDILRELHAAQAAAGFAMLGVIWMVQLIQYPQFLEWPADDFVQRHERYARRITPIVGTFMTVEFVAVWGLFWLRVVELQHDPARPILYAACVAVTWLSTLVLQVPLHNRLHRGKDDAVIRRLIATNWIRTAAWTIKAAAVLTA